MLWGLSAGGGGRRRAGGARGRVPARAAGAGAAAGRRAARARRPGRRADARRRHARAAGPQVTHTRVWDWLRPACRTVGDDDEDSIRIILVVDIE